MNEMTFIKINNIIYKETILCFPSIVLIILVGLVEVLTIYEYNNIKWKSNLRYKDRFCINS